MGRFMIGLVACGTLIACAPPMLETEPPGGTVPHNTVVLVDDGTCPADQIKKITGGSDDLGIPRTRQCISRP
jgi:hypothetical protein